MLCEHAGVVKFLVIITKHRMHLQTFFGTFGWIWYAIFKTSGRKKKEKDYGY
jgi:hypothetical protein